MKNRIALAVVAAVLPLTAFAPAQADAQLGAHKEVRIQRAETLGTCFTTGQHRWVLGTVAITHWSRWYLRSVTPGPCPT